MLRAYTFPIYAAMNWAESGDPIWDVELRVKLFLSRYPGELIRDVTNPESLSGRYETVAPDRIRINHVELSVSEVLLSSL